MSGSVRSSRSESDASSVLASGRLAAVGSDDEDRRRVGKKRSVVLCQPTLGTAREPLVRLVDAAREGEVAEHSPDDAEHEQADDAEDDPETPPSAASRFLGPSGGLGGASTAPVERDSALDTATAIPPVGLVSLGHPGRYGSPRP